MKNLSASILFLLLAFTVSSVAKPAAQLKSELLDIIPAGKKAKLAWTKGGFHRDDLYTGNHDRSVYVVDSDDGIIRELTPDSIFPEKKRNIDNPSITFDGSRVIFYEGYSGLCYVINWNGTGLKSFKVEGFMSRYWHDPVAGTDWVTVHQYNVSRINVDNPTQQVYLWGLTDLTRPWFTLSPDGTHLGFSPGGQNVGIAKVPNGELILADSIGCRTNISPDNNYDIMFQLPYHRIIRICDSTGRKKSDHIITDTIISWAKKTNHLNSCRPYMEYETLRWSNHPDYITFYTYFTNVNPFIWRLSDGKWMWVDDSLGACGYAGNMDMVVLDTSALPPSAPSVMSVPDFLSVVNLPIVIRVIGIKNLPLSTITVTGLPPGLSIVKDSVAAASFKLSGTPTSVGSFVAIATATNNLGSATDTFTIQINATNTAPVVSAGQDVMTRIGRKFSLAGSASDDGFPNLFPTVWWRRISGPGTFTIAVSVSATSQVSFADTSLGDHIFEIAAYDGELSTRDTVVVTVKPAFTPKVLSPVLKDTVHAGATTTVKWTIDFPAAVVLLFSTDNWKNEIDITGNKTIPATDTTYDWAVSADLINSDNCQIRVVDYLSKTEMAMSAKFSLRGGISSIRHLYNAKPNVLQGTYQYFTLDGRKVDSKGYSQSTRMRQANASGIIIRKSRNVAVQKDSKLVVMP